MRSTSWSALMCPSCRRNTDTMKSRLLERRPPAGRCLSTNSVADGTATLLGRERRPAAASRLGVRILDGEAAAHVVVDEVNFGALQITQTDRIDEQADAVHQEGLVGVLVALAVLDHEAVLEA